MNETRGNTVDFLLALGEEVRHLTGFRGVVTGRVQYYSGCVQYLVKPMCQEGETHKMPEGEWIDEDQLTSLGEVWFRGGNDTNVSRKGGLHQEAPKGGSLQS